MAEVLLISAAKGILDGLLSLEKNQIEDLIVGQVKLAWDFKKDLEKFCNKLEFIQGLLADAENRKITSAAMTVWLKRLKAATSDAENVLDELAYEALRRKVEVPIAVLP
ncbi:hypothetical protein Vadar_016010 [Vaccinium darrowii]|uniref:Uncharacterized protein n=1 Tax=Vaccinium darrowii TaxID=229202 RepID=A0ACB7XS79_9ERIC|nr:hypothetical protein Vadar_016010 [Vaccinium darrowii]